MKSQRLALFSKLVLLLLFYSIYAKISCPHHLIARPSLRKPGSVDRNDFLLDLEDCLLSFIESLNLNDLSPKVTRKSSTIFEIEFTYRPSDPFEVARSINEKPIAKPRTTVSIHDPDIDFISMERYPDSKVHDSYRPTPRPRTFKVISTSTNPPENLGKNEIPGKNMTHFRDWEGSIKLETALFNILSEQELQEFEVNSQFEGHQDYFAPSAPYEEEPWVSLENAPRGCSPAGDDTNLRAQDVVNCVQNHLKSPINGTSLSFLEEETKWVKALHLLRAMFEKGLGIFRSPSIGPSKNNFLLSTELPTQESTYFSTGFAAWTFTAEDKDMAGISGGLDNKFITESNDGTTKFFGVTDGHRSSSVSLNSRSISESIFHYAETLFREAERQLPLSPVDVMTRSYHESILDPQVEYGSTAALFGRIDEHKCLRICKSGTPWAAVFRNGEIFFQTHALSEHLHEDYPLIKDPYLMRTNSLAQAKHSESRISEYIQQVIWPLQRGDIVLATTNGLYKRMNSEQIVRSINISLSRGSNMGQAATSLVEAAIGVLQVDVDETPYWIHSQEKEEDIMVVMIEIK